MNWPEDEFLPTRVTLVSGNVVEMLLAERATLLGSKKSERVWVREMLPLAHQPQRARPRKAMIAMNVAANIMSGQPAP